jgi:hypothetical protein
MLLSWIKTWRVYCIRLCFMRVLLPGHGNPAEDRQKTWLASLFESKSAVLRGSGWVMRFASRQK